ncbi:MAG: aminoglycoside phosphotransferase family protein [Streptosporangiales bacterium]|nr:aminoglycoside phosphotransferase family protein [Streptosporangiales bacterium]
MANVMPKAEVGVTAGLVRHLLSSQHPDLAGLPVTFLASGWDNTLYRVGDRLVARLPRRALGAETIVNEQRWLPELAPALPLPVPYAERVGAPNLMYRWHWSLTPYLPGEPVSAGGDLDWDAAAVALGEFLRALHVPAPKDAPLNPFRGCWVGNREDSFRSNLTSASGQVDTDAALRAWASATAAPLYDGPSVWLHGDLHPANILAHEGKISGVIDWGDMTAGDPATDLSVAWAVLPPEHHDAFWKAYGTDNDALRARAHGWALRLGLVFLAFSDDSPDMLAIGQRTLSRVLGPA